MLVRASQIKALREVRLRRFKSGTIGKVLNSKKEIAEVLNNSTFNLQEVFSNNNNDVKIDTKILNKVLKHSGLKTFNKEEELDYIRALESQLKFIKFLYDDDKEFDRKENSNESVFRLLHSDHQPTLCSLELVLADIRELHKQRDDEKGETDFTFSINQLNKNHKNYFIIQQGSKKED
ncbi:uncharacterized protein PRCAT00005910001 [Priceomyces carsonii]|uniref:uncharacterized protein n=1 Tax=Priceomyces carsonii TaxID=28549 RepID=UPI002ED93DA6|nr:unnamed protein product [Priceomyces carsonii]